MRLRPWPTFGLVLFTTCWEKPRRRKHIWSGSSRATRRAGGASSAALVGFDILPHAFAISAINKLSLGYLDEALARSARAVSTAQELGDQYGLAFASAVGSMTLYLLGNDLRALQERAELCCSHCEKHGIAWWQYYAGAFLGWLAVTRGEVAPGIERMRGAMAAWQATGMLLGVDSHAVLLADVCLKVMRFGSRDKTPSARTAAGACSPTRLRQSKSRLAPGSPSGPCYEAELLRMRGELLLAREGLAATDEALDCFERARTRGR